MWIETILRRTRNPAFESYLQRLLLELCHVDTTPNSDVSRMRAAEDACFRTLESELSSLSFRGAKLERRPIRPDIRESPHYSLLHFTKTPQRPEGLSAEETYAGRSNLLYLVPGASVRPMGQSIALNGHLDVVAPYFPPRVEQGIIFGRGACDDKGPVVSIVAALRVLAEVVVELGLPLNRNIVAMFVVEEETGGNGSLSLALDRDLQALYESVLVTECTGLQVHPANRGAVWYCAELAPPTGVSALEMFAFVNEEMEKEGAAIRAESYHALFPQRPVQTCHGILGPYGEHPSRICGLAGFNIQFARPADRCLERLVQDCLEAGLATYVGLYGDKTKVVEPSGKPMIPTHYEVTSTSRGFDVRVWGAAGHMGSIRERDGAITKLAHLVRSLVYSRDRLEACGGAMTLSLGGETTRPASPLVVEGGQGFVPTHRIDEVMHRLRRAAQLGAGAYLRRLGRPEPADQVVKICYEKLHNVAFDGDPDSPAVRCAAQAAALCGLPLKQPILGWTVSCDARLFAAEYPGMPVLTFGPGQLIHAHSDQEQITLEELRAAVEFLCVYLLLQTGTLEGPSAPQPAPVDLKP
jgi:acetylornithine deacetylase/succinyl-diaminopimelate desuccinylase-like protein